METRLTYAILFVADMEQAVAFYRDSLGLKLKFQSPFWSEFDSGETRLALHPASERNPAGKVQLGFGVADLQAAYEVLAAQGIQFTQAPTVEAGSLIATFLSPEGVEVSLGQTQ